MSGGVGGIEPNQHVAPLVPQQNQNVQPGTFSYVKGSYSMLAESSFTRNMGSSISTLGEGIMEVRGNPKSGAYKMLTGLLSTGTTLTTGMLDATTNTTDALVSRADNSLANMRNQAWQSGSYTKTVALLGAQAVVKSVGTANTLVQVGTGMLELFTYPSKTSNVANDPGVNQTTEQRVKSALTSFNESPFVSDQLKTTVKTLTDLNPPNGMSKDQFLAEVFSGAHVVVDGDKGALYQQLNTNPNAYNRGSSHYDNRNPVTLALNVATNTHPMASPHMQRGIDLPNGMGHLLFGTRNNGGTIESWFQIEAHGTGAREFAPHMADFFVHKGSGFKQVAPFGLSTHTEKQVGQQAPNELHVS